MKSLKLGSKSNSHTRIEGVIAAKRLRQEKKMQKGGTQQGSSRVAAPLEYQASRLVDAAVLAASFSSNAPTHHHEDGCG